MTIKQILSTLDSKQQVTIYDIKKEKILARHFAGYLHDIIDGRPYKDYKVVEQENRIYEYLINVEEYND